MVFQQKKLRILQDTHVKSLNSIIFQLALNTTDDDLNF